MPDRTRPHPRPCADGISLARYDLPFARAQGASAPGCHDQGSPVEELTGSHRASAAVGLFPVQGGGHADGVRHPLKGNRGEGDHDAYSPGGARSYQDTDSGRDDDDPDANDPHRAARGVITGMLMGCAAYGLLVAAVWLSQKLGEWLL